MKVAQINSVCGSGSTGKISVAISKLLTEQGIDNVIFYVQGNSDYQFGEKYMYSDEVKWQALKAKVCGTYGFQTKRATHRLIKALDEFNPDMVQLHNLHGHNAHLGLLFSYLKERKIKIFWTFHDCWAFTGYCMYFDAAACDQWHINCKKCPQRKKYSWFFDRSSWLYKKKRTLLSGLDMTIITPSQWLAELVKKSFLANYPIRVIHNGIDLNVFYPRESNFREKYSIPDDKMILLGVANKWEKRKGLDVFVELAQRLDAKRYQIVLVGTNKSVDKQLPQNIISIHHTANQEELAEVYSAADIFVNPTREENYPSVNMEAIACGTPVLTFRTGGSPEILDDACGCVVEKDDIDGLEKEVIRICKMKPYSVESCMERAKHFDKNTKFQEYIKLYEVLNGEK